MSQETGLVSFVLRFVYDETPSDTALPTANWRGVIRHVQSDAERHFTQWSDALAFIEAYVNLRQDAPDSGRDV